jgi:general L-amino acid transport system permease protein
MASDRPSFRGGEDLTTALLPDEAAVEVAPVSAPATPSEWVRQNLFSSWLNGVLTIVSGAFAAFIAYRAFNFVFATAEWQVVRAFMKGYMVGRFPIEEVWRIWVCTFLVVALAGISLGASRWQPRMGVRKLVVVIVIAAIMSVILLFTAETALVRLLAVAVMVLFAATTALGRGLGTGSH